MGKLDDYSLDQVAGSLALIISSIGGLLLICFKSRCTNVRLLWGCYDCQRNVSDETEDDKKTTDKKEKDNKKKDTNIINGPEPEPENP